jgi:hypothetical protein
MQTGHKCRDTVYSYACALSRVHCPTSQADDERGVTNSTCSKQLLSFETPTSKISVHEVSLLASPAHVCVCMCYRKSVSITCLPTLLRSMSREDRQVDNLRVYGSVYVFTEIKISVTCIHSFQQLHSVSRDSCSYKSVWL